MNKKQQQGQSSYSKKQDIDKNKQQTIPEIYLVIDR
tara:strand:- start:235 stop:342 length:108 start_codon:yes stop_codon:yes gene_type:complete